MAKKEKLAYSPMENKLLTLLHSGKELTLSELANHIYDEGDAPTYPRESIRNTLTRLGGKLKTNREKFAIWHSERCGPREVRYWVE